MLYSKLQRSAFLSSRFTAHKWIPVAKSGPSQAIWEDKCFFLILRNSHASCWHSGKLQEAAGVVHHSLPYPTMCRVTILSGEGATIAMSGERLIVKQY